MLLVAAGLFWVLLLCCGSGIILLYVVAGLGLALAAHCMYNDAYHESGGETTVKSSEKDPNILKTTFKNQFRQWQQRPTQAAATGVNGNNGPKRISQIRVAAATQHHCCQFVPICRPAAPMPLNQRPDTTEAGATPFAAAPTARSSSQQAGSRATSHSGILVQQSQHSGPLTQATRTAACARCSCCRAVRRC